MNHHTHHSLPTGVTPFEVFFGRKYRLRALTQPSKFAALNEIMQVDEETLDQAIEQNKNEIDEEYERVLKLHDVVDEKDEESYDDQDDINEEEEEVLLDNLRVSESDFRHMDDVVNSRLRATEGTNSIQSPNDETTELEPARQTDLNCQVDEQ